MPGLTVTTQGRIATVVIDRPPVNALSRETYREIRQVLHSCRDRDDVSVIIFTGAGDRSFCGGRDIHDLKTERAEPRSANIGDPYHLTPEAFFAVRHCAVPVICAVNAAAVGAGVALAAVSDIVIAAEEATFALTEINVGVLGAASFAQWMIGPGKARRMFYTGHRIPLAQMYRLGGVEAVVPRSQLLSEARVLADEIASKDPVAIRMAKASVVRIDTLPLEAAYRREQDYTRHLSAYENSAAAIRRFVKK